MIVRDGARRMLAGVLQAEADAYIAQFADQRDERVDAVHGRAKEAQAEIWNAEDDDHALAAVKPFEAACGAKLGKAVSKVTDDIDVLLAFYGFPAEHWIHLRTINPIESTFAIVRHRIRVTKGSEGCWRPVNASDLAALERAGARFERAVPVERDEVTAA